MKRFNVELSFAPYGWKTVQETAQSSSGAAYQALAAYPVAQLATAWLPGGARGLERTDVATATPAMLHAGREPLHTDCTTQLASFVPVQWLMGGAP